MTSEKLYGRGLVLRHRGREQRLIREIFPSGRGPRINEMRGERPGLDLNVSISSQNGSRVEPAVHPVVDIGAWFLGWQVQGGVMPVVGEGVGSGTPTPGSTPLLIWSISPPGPRTPKPVQHKFCQNRSTLSGVPIKRLPLISRLLAQIPATSRYLSPTRVQQGGEPCRGARRYRETQEKAHSDKQQLSR